MSGVNTILMRSESLKNLFLPVIMSGIANFRDSVIKFTGFENIRTEFWGRSAHHIKNHWMKIQLLWSKAPLQKRHSLAWVMNLAGNFEGKGLMKRWNSVKRILGCSEICKDFWHECLGWCKALEAAKSNVSTNSSSSLKWWNDIWQKVAYFPLTFFIIYFLG